MSLFGSCNVKTAKLKNGQVGCVLCVGNDPICITYKDDKKNRWICHTIIEVYPDENNCNELLEDLSKQRYIMNAVKKLKNLIDENHPTSEIFKESMKMKMYPMMSGNHGGYNYNNGKFISYKKQFINKILSCLVSSSATIVAETT